jgi:AMP-binding enzyme
MPDWTISAPDLEPTSAHALAAHLAPDLTAAPSPRTWLLTGDNQPGLAALTYLALAAGHRVVLPPHSSPRRDLHLPSGLGMNIHHSPSDPVPMPGTDVRAGWDLALFSSGSTTGRPRAYGFTCDQLATVTSWYETIYRVSGDSVIVTALPVHYNFTVIAGVLLAARLGARLHLAGTFHDVLTDAAQLAKTADRVAVLANPVALDQATPAPQLPAHVMIDSGGAPLSTTAITDYRAHGIDVREGYGLTETASLTHFDTEAAATSLGTVGTAMPGVATAITSQTGRPLVEVTSPATAIPLDPAERHVGPTLRTTDLGHVDDHGRLRLLGRADDHQISGLWPHDTLDMLGPLLGRRCALVRHPTADQATVRVLTPISPNTTGALKDRAAELLGLQLDHITITSQGQAPLLHSAKLTRAPT